MVAIIPVFCPLSRKNAPHHNVYGKIEKVKGMKFTNHSQNGAKSFIRTITVFKFAGKALFVTGALITAYEIYHAEDKTREVVRQVFGWAAASAGAYGGAKLGALAGAAVGAHAAGAGAAPGAVIGGFLGGIAGGIGGWWAGTTITEWVYDWLLTPLEKEEYNLVCIEK